MSKILTIFDVRNKLKQTVQNSADQRIIFVDLFVGHGVLVIVKILVVRY